MKAFLLAGGQGTRLRPLTDTMPKCLVPICGTPLLEIWLELCARSGITEALINVHAHMKALEEFLWLHNSPVKVSLIHEEHMLGSAGTLAANREWIGTDPAFWILYSDVLTDADLNGMEEFHLRRGKIATLGTYRVPDPARCGVALTDEKSVIVDFEEKPQAPRSNSVFSGIMLASPEIFDRIPPSIPADIGFHVLPRLVGEMVAYPIDGYLLDIGTIPNYEQAQTTWPGFRASSGQRIEASAASAPTGRKKRATANG